jgi:hypothetical protein
MYVRHETLSYVHQKEKIIIFQPVQFILHFIHCDSALGGSEVCGGRFEFVQYALGRALRKALASTYERL